MEKITILIADDHPLVRETWSFILNTDPRFKVIAEAAQAQHRDHGYQSAGHEWN